jgi:RNA polymerase sigma factor (sigma-70 family)
MNPVFLRRHGDRAFERLYQANVGDVYRYALAITGNQSDAEDVAQTTFMNAYRAFERGERPVRERNWLIAITHNVCRQRFRQAARRPTEVVFNDEVAESLVPTDDAPTAADIQRALGHLELSHREALVMRELQGRTYAEIAEVMGLSVGAVETLLFRARRALREQLEGTLTCSEAEVALSRQLDGRLSRGDAGSLRAHLRECDDCRRLARRQRAQRKSVRALAAIPVPASLGSWLGGGAAVTGAGAGAGGIGIGLGIAAKGAVAIVAAVAAGAGSYTVVEHVTAPPVHHGTGPEPTVVHHTAKPTKPTKPAKPAAGPTPSKHKGTSAHPHPSASSHAKPTHPVHPTHPAAPVQAHSQPAKSKPTHPASHTKPTHPPNPAKPQAHTQTTSSGHGNGKSVATTETTTKAGPQDAHGSNPNASANTNANANGNGNGNGSDNGHGGGGAGR